MTVYHLTTAPQLSTLNSQIYVTNEGQSASLSWCQAPICGPKPDICYYQTVAFFVDVGHPI
jgi:hypothetical protein